MHKSATTAKQCAEAAKSLAQLYTYLVKEDNSQETKTCRTKMWGRNFPGSYSIWSYFSSLRKQNNEV